MTVRDRIREAFCAWQRTDRNRSLDTLTKILETEFADTPDPNSVRAVLSDIRRRGWQKVSPEERRARMRWVAQHPRPSRRKRTIGAA